MTEQISDRLLDRRLRNRVMEAVDILADGGLGLRAVGHADYFEIFHGCIPRREDGEMNTNSAINAAERAALPLMKRRGSLSEDQEQTSPLLLGQSSCPKGARPPEGGAERARLWGGRTRARRRRRAGRLTWASAPTSPPPVAPA
ncbi:hypothetical protein [Acidimangrovimonas pyrenivorans]|uniref:Uncharacterized protein n=1 Tax=Acidimangrovimonas pyrenivorans TaxID=2030798 RepID=A0ABV7AFQ0_9RHOB